MFRFYRLNALNKLLWTKLNTVILNTAPKYLQMAQYLVMFYFYLPTVSCTTYRNNVLRSNETLESCIMFNLTYKIYMASNSLSVK
jgi:hypothetical protein